MIQLSNEIVLRPRFQFRVSQPVAQLRECFKAAKCQGTRFHISCVDDHIFIRLPRNQQHYWSPQLHLELMENEDGSSTVFGYFGPNPTVWTFFMFLHVVVGILFMVNLIWLYSNYNLGNTISLQIAILLVLILAWFGLYLAGRMGKKRGKPGMHELYDFMNGVLKFPTTSANPA